MSEPATGPGRAQVAIYGLSDVSQADRESGTISSQHNAGDDTVQMPQNEGDETVQQEHSSVHAYVASQAELGDEQDIVDGNDADDDDWLYSSGDEQPGHDDHAGLSGPLQESVSVTDDSARVFSASEAGNTVSKAANKGPDYIDMASRDSRKVENQFEDTGYREGITAGKLSTLQAGFDEGFETVGAPYGRRLGVLKGRADVLRSACVQMLRSMEAHHRRHQVGDETLQKHDEAEAEEDDSPAGNVAHVRLRRAAGIRSAHQIPGHQHHAASDAPSLSSTSSPSFLPPSFSFTSLSIAETSGASSAANDLRALLNDQLESIRTDLSELNLDRLAEPDWEALEHELEHANLAQDDDDDRRKTEARGAKSDEDSSAAQTDSHDDSGEYESFFEGMRQVRRETMEQRAKRENILPALEARIQGAEDALFKIISQLQARQPKGRPSTRSAI